MFTLMKVSHPGWEKDFNTEQEVANELSKYVCRSCKLAEELSDNPTIDDLLNTDCGCEFVVEDRRKTN
jgi:hypothetical protein